MAYTPLKDQFPDLYKFPEMLFLPLRSVGMNICGILDLEEFIRIGRFRGLQNSLAQLEDMGR